MLTRYSQELRHRKSEYTNKINNKHNKNKHILYTEHIEYEDIQLQQAIELSLIEELRYNNPPPLIYNTTTSNSSSIPTIKEVHHASPPGAATGPHVGIDIEGKDRPVPPSAGTGSKATTTVWGSDTPQSFKNATKVR